MGRLKKQMVHKFLGNFRGSRIPRAKPSVDFNERILFGFDFIHQQGFPNRIGTRNTIGNQNIKFVDTGIF